jgi:hypothetical protein
MIPGPTIILSCPFCGQYAKKRTIISGNTSGSQLWSDGKKISPMMPDFPSLVLCKKCDQFYWVRKELQVEEVRDYREFETRNRDIEYVEFPSFHQYFKALETINAERYIRMKIWWSYNDYFRNGHQSEITLEMQKLNTENLIALIKILDEAVDNDLLMKAEIFRQLGWFDESRQLLIRMSNDDLAWVKEKILIEISNRNDQVFRLFKSDT